MVTLWEEEAPWALLRVTAIDWIARVKVAGAAELPVMVMGKVAVKALPEVCEAELWYQAWNVLSTGAVRVEFVTVWPDAGVTCSWIWVTERLVA